MLNICARCLMKKYNKYCSKPKDKNKMGLELFLTAPLYFYNLFCVKNKFTVINYLLLGKTSPILTARFGQYWYKGWLNDLFKLTH